jgi:hypothetical protein
MSICLKTINELYSSGLSIKKVAEKTNISATQIRRILLKNNIEIRKTRTSNEVENEILKQYNLGKNSEIIAKDFNLHPTTICKIIKRLNGKIRPPEINKRKYKVKEDFFIKINTEEKAYLLGFLYADGSVNKNKNSFKLCVHKKDIDILYKLKELLYFNKGPKICIDREYRYIDVSSKQLKKDLIKHGCTPCKTFTITLPNINKKLFHHFIRGIYDGDGCISTSNNRIRVCLTGYTNFLQEIKEQFENINIKSFIYNYKNKKNVSNLIVSKKSECYKILKLLYIDSNIYLNRKYNKAIKVLNESITKKVQ